MHGTDIRYAYSPRVVGALADHRLLTAQEVAQHLRVSVKTIYRRAARGELPCVRYGRTVLFVERSIEEDILRRGGDRNGVDSKDENGVSRPLARGRAR